MMVTVFVIVKILVWVALMRAGYAMGLGLYLSVDVKMEDVPTLRPVILTRRLSVTMGHAVTLLDAPTREHVILICSLFVMMGHAFRIVQ